MHDSSQPTRTQTFERLTLAVLLLLLILRIGAILATPLELYADEAQYWRWSTSLAWGYYSKPPMIAWVIHLTTSLFGTHEWAVRIAAPLLHTIAAGLIFLTGRAMLDARAGFFAALLYALMPSVVLSSSVLSTDGVLMPFWCGALFLYWRLRSGEGSWVSAALLGAMIGFGMLSKYAMLYFVIGMGLTALIDAPSRRALLSLRSAVTVLVAGLIVAPHFAWNAANGFETVSHTVDNANLGGKLFNPENALSWFGDQLGMFGPVSFFALVVGLFLFRNRSGEEASRERWLLCFILPVLIFILFQAILSRAHANWTATAYPGAALLVALWFSRGRSITLWSSVALNVVLAGVFMAVALLPQATTSSLGLDNAMKRTRGWEASAEQIFAEAERLGATAVLVDEREVWHDLDFYAQDRTIPLISWRRYGGPKSFSEKVPLEGAMTERVLVASLNPDMRPRLRSDFTTFEPVGQVRIDLGVRSNGCPITRVFQLYIGEGYDRQERDQDWETRYIGEAEFRDPPCSAATQKR
ncbi:glycosyltransferase family 39 protein [Hyphomonas sp. WL0036]|uniref:ArnT family glycosyltransferase n=1 Tax=Hyphomonas sediminis TaxID=2866160 RepID=UPI001C81C5CD|nr:glycosyltransferase family 39 protein [Hyphomonas sediminis]MBY9066555.1 glycosyltransferase family 39 protein [Hyphomonas sediminis]